MELEYSKAEQTYLNSHLYICPVCGKQFIVNNLLEYCYKLTIKQKRTPYCSYTCFRKVQTKLYPEPKKSTH